MELRIRLMKKILIFALFTLCSFNAFAEFKAEGWTPRYTYFEDDNLIGEAHYVGVSYFKRQGAAFEGPTARIGVGKGGEKINLGYTSGSEFFGVDVGFSYNFLNSNNPRKPSSGLGGLGVEVGLRLWVVQFIMQNTEDTSYISLGFGF
ncbi:MAG: YD repeat-containing protein [Oleiphilaceae bacterium]|jgi:YD repeat-containing protein